VKAGYFLELPARGCQQVLARLGQTLRNRPGPGVSAFPEWAAGMGQKYFEASTDPAKQQQTRAGFGGQGWTRSAQKYPAGSGSLRPVLLSMPSRKPGSPFHQPQKPSDETAVIVRCST